MKYSNLGIEAVLLYSEDIDNQVIDETIASLGVDVTFKKIL